MSSLQKADRKVPFKTRLLWLEEVVGFINRLNFWGEVFLWLEAPPFWP